SLSAHGADFLRLDLVGDANLTRLPEGINGLAKIFLRKLIDVVIGATFCDLHDTAANFKIAVGIRGILKRDGHARIAPNVYVFYAALRGIEANVSSVVVDPNRRDLRAAIFHQCA